MRVFQIGDEDLNTQVVEELNAKLKNNGADKIITAEDALSFSNFPINGNVSYDANGFTRVIVENAGKKYYKNIDVFKVDPNR